MAQLELPHTAGCLVCGRQNPHGLRLSLHVDEGTGIVSTQFVPRPEHIGFEGIVHGGVIATVVDEVMVWAATWAGKRFCVCGELSLRFRRSAEVGQSLHVKAKVESHRSRLIQTSATVLDANGDLLATGSGKYVPLSPEQNRAFVKTIVDDAQTEPTTRRLRDAAMTHD